MQSPTPPSMHDQRVWGGNSFQPSRSASQPPTGLHRSPSSHAGILASNSDTLFHPIHHDTVPSSHPYELRNVPFPSHIHNPTSQNAYTPPFAHIPVRRDHLSRPPLPHNIINPSASSYNNDFVVPPPFPEGVPPNQHSIPFSPHFSQPNQGFPNPQFPYPPPQYIYYVPQQIPSNPVSRSLPSVVHIPVLTSKTDFFAWDKGVTSLLRAHGLLGHILDPQIPPDPSRPDRISTAMPVLSLSPTQEELAALTRWWDDDNAVQHVLTSRIGNVPRGLLPSSNLVARTGLSIYQTLIHYYGTTNFADCAELFNSLNTLTCLPGRVQEYVSRWRIGISRLQSANFPVSIKLCISQFIRGLPVIAAFNTLRAALPTHISNASDNDYGAFVTMTETALELDTIFKSAIHLSRPTRPANSHTAPIQDPTSRQLNIPSSVDSTKSNPPPSAPGTGTTKICTNCGRRGHLVPTCFEPGGGMEGRRDEFRRDRNKVVAMLVATLEAACNATDDSDDSPDPINDAQSDVLDDTSVPASESVAFPMSSQLNENLGRDLYPMRDPKSYLSSVSGPVSPPGINHTALLSLGAKYNSCLDSGCTDHIIRDRHLFQTYDEAGAVDIGTANCGSLSAKGSGDVSFRIPHDGRFVVFNMRGCLHAPNALINLISVGALTENRLSVIFRPDAPTKISYSMSEPDLPGFSFFAQVFHRLSLLQLDFIVPDESPHSHALAALTFPKTTYSSTLWHRRFGHLGMDATREALTKEYATGIQFSGPFTQEHCVACIVGKSPQHSYSHSGHRASRVGELLHMDICGPYPVQTPDGKRHFIVMLDDTSNFGFTTLLRLRSDAYLSFCRTESFLLRSHNAKIVTVRVDGALELTKGPMGDHFIKQGITVQRTAPYAHQQNGKIERYVRTIEEGGQTLLADSGLPMNFWGWAVLTSQYLRNRLPTSTLPVNITPLEALSSKKPDLFHLRVWGCQCFVTIPPELRTKAGPRRFEAIFVGYEENRIGWTVRDLTGRIHFSRDVIFNEDLSGRFKIPRSISSCQLPTPTSESTPTSSRPIRNRTQTIAGQQYTDTLRLKEFRASERAKKRTALYSVSAGTNGGAACVAVDVCERYDCTNGGALCVAVDVNGNGDTNGGVTCVNTGMNGGAVCVNVDVHDEGVIDLCGDNIYGDTWVLSEDLLEDFISFLASSDLSSLTPAKSLTLDEHEIFWDHCLTFFPTSSLGP